MGTDLILPPLDEPSFKANPYPYWARLRAEEPVSRQGGEDGVWLITRYDDVHAAFQDDRLLKNAQVAMTPEQRERQPWEPSMFGALGHSMLDSDPPDHTRLRSLVSRGFVPRIIGRLRESIQSLCDALLDTIDARGDGTFDLVAEYAEPLPSTITSRLLGFPEEDLHRWSQIYLTDQPESPLDAMREMWKFMSYCRELFEQRRREPADDLISAFVQTQGSEEGLSDDELISMAALLFEAGHVTTVNLIGSGMLALFDQPDQLALLRERPHLIGSAVEELLRFTNPLDLAPDRYPREDLTIGGVAIPRGETVLLVIGSANRDERKFAHPDRLDITRTPNDHLAFGWGRHFCLGAGLARLETQIAILTLLRRFPHLRPGQPRESVRWRAVPLLRGPASVTLAY